ncbi:MAG: DUF2279 domain-containing protein [Saprospiraceae bacterium]|jgi:uncharacterized protein YfiM (DUF2279 family)
MNITTRLKQYALSLVFFCGILASIQAQSGYQSFFTPSDTLNKRRVLLASGFGLISYSGFSIGLYNAWYSKQGLGKFHAFNDLREWMHMDKAAHMFNSYFQSEWGYHGARWCGYSSGTSMIWGVSMAMLFQSTIEVMDGFSNDYGFSWPDMAGNVIGIGLFTSQQLIWDEQKFRIKLSSWPKKYSKLPPNEMGDPGYSFEDRAHELYGSGFLNSTLKDYNTQTFWLTFNPERLVNGNWKNWPDCLNVSLGFGADGLFGGFTNNWVRQNIVYNAEWIPRVNEYYLALDIDLSKIKTRNRFLKTLFQVFNIVKIPSPTLEINSIGRVKGHWLFF